MPPGIYVRTEKHKKNWFKKGHKSSKNITKGEKAWNWKGGEAGYDALHDWVNRNLGKPDTCEKCGKSGLTGRSIHWANKDHTYKRNLTDWIRLCMRCHVKYDIENNNRPNNY